MPLYAPRYGVIVEGRPYMGGEPISPEHVDLYGKELRAVGAHTDSRRALFDNVNYPHPTENELKGDKDKGIAPIPPPPEIGKRPLAPDALRPLRKEDLKGRMPYDARPNSRTP